MYIISNNLFDFDITKIEKNNVYNYNSIKETY